MRTIIDNVFVDENIYFNHFYGERIDVEDFPLEPHTHDVCELLFLKKGNPEYLVEGKAYRLSKNTLIISRPGDRHAIHFEETGPYERYNILYDERKLPFDLYGTIPAKLDIINFDGNSLVCELFKKADYYSEHFEGEKLGRLMSSLVEEIFFNISIAVKDIDVSDYSAVSANPLISSALAYIEKNLTANITIESICNELYITKSHLHHLFVSHLKISPKKYILSKRLGLARRAIRSGRKPIEACMQSGFSDYSTFYRDYKNFFGHCPSEELNFKPDKNVTFFS